jgi:C-terminal processing protease CtpA/Prc
MALRRVAALALAIAACAGVACGGGSTRSASKGTAKTTTTTAVDDTNIGTTTSTIAPKNPAEYLKQALDIIQDNAFYSSKLDWTSERAKAAAMTAGATTFADTYDAIATVLKDLGDRHSRFATPEDVQESAGGVTPEGPPQGSQPAPGIAELALPQISGPQTSPGAKRYVDNAESILRGSPTACGWILDLRGNPGGNLVPMMLAAAPLLGDGDQVLVRDNENQPHPFALHAKQVFYDGKVIKGISGSMDPITPPPPVAVLTDDQTASSAEFLLLALRVRPNTRTFGLGTVGLSGGNGVFPLADKAQIVLTISLAEDLRGRRYDGPIPPDVELPPDQAPAAAVRWLQSQPACQGKS